MQRFGMSVRLPPEHRDRYLALHARVWPEVVTALSDANITNYTIFRRDDLLFGYYEYTGTDHRADMARLAADPATQRWWTLTDPCQERLAGTPDGQQWASWDEIWHQR